MASDIKTSQLWCLRVRLYSTLLPQAAGQPIWTAAGFTASWASHPREDLSRLPSLLAAGTGQKYHCP